MHDVFQSNFDSVRELSKVYNVYRRMYKGLYTMFCGYVGSAM